MRIGCGCGASFATMTPVIEAGVVYVDVFVASYDGTNNARLPGDLLVIQEFLDKHTPKWGCLRARMFKDLKAKLESLMKDEIQPLLHELKALEREEFRRKYVDDVEAVVRKLEYIDNPACKDYSYAEATVKLYTLG